MFIVKYLAKSVGISPGANLKSLTKETKLREVCVRLVPNLVTEKQKATRVHMGRILIRNTK